MSSSHSLEFSTSGHGLYLITEDLVSELQPHFPQTGLLHLFLQHTSAALLIQENADPTARADLESFYQRLAPDGQSWHRHTLEGPDDTTAHMKASLLPHALSLPIAEGQLALGTWQGIYLCEFRSGRHRRKIHATIMG